MNKKVEKKGNLIGIKFSNGEEKFHYKIIADQLYESFMSMEDEYHFSYQDEKMLIHYSRSYVIRVIYLKEE